MAKRRFRIMILLFCFCLCTLPCRAVAASTTDAKEPIDTGRNCTMTISYCCDGTAFSNQTVKLYQIAEISADFQYALTESFFPTGLILNGIQTQGEWNVVRATMEAYILANNTEPLMTAITDEAGGVCFESLKPGLYLVAEMQIAEGDLSCAFDSALIALPGLDGEGYWQYDVAVAAKPVILPPIDPDEKTELKVLKLWRGDEGLGTRPQSVEVEIFRNGISYAGVILSEENHWSYSWSAKNNGADWKVVERNVPSGYTMTVEQRETTFVITNTRPDQPSPPPQTGDTANILLYTVLMYVSGTMLIILGIAGKRKRHEETN